MVRRSVRVADPERVRARALPALKTPGRRAHALERERHVEVGERAVVDVDAETAPVAARARRVVRVLDLLGMSGRRASKTSVGVLRMPEPEMCISGAPPSRTGIAPWPTKWSVPSAQKSGSVGPPVNDAPRSPPFPAGTASGQRLGQRLVDDVDGLHGRPAVHEDRRRREGVEHRPRPRPDLDRAEVALVDRLVACRRRSSSRYRAAETTVGHRAVDRPDLLAAGALVKSTTTSLPAISTLTSNGTSSSATPFVVHARRGPT